MDGDADLQKQIDQLKAALLAAINGGPIGIAATDPSTGVTTWLTVNDPTVEFRHLVVTNFNRAIHARQNELVLSRGGR